MRTVPALIVFLLFAFRGVSLAQDYDDCRMRCDAANDACINQPQASDPEVEAIKAHACDENLESCYSGCESLKPTGDDMSPQTNPDLIRPDQR